MPNVSKMQFPCAMHSILIFRNLGRCQLRCLFCGVMQRNGKNVCRAIREPDARPSQRNLHNFTREVATKMRHVLISGGYATPGSVIVGAEMRRHAAPLCGHGKRAQLDLTTFVENGLLWFNTSPV